MIESIKPVSIESTASVTSFSVGHSNADVAPLDSLLAAANNLQKEEAKSIEKFSKIDFSSTASVLEANKVMGEHSVKFNFASKFASLATNAIKQVVTGQ